MKPPHYLRYFRCGPGDAATDPRRELVPRGVMKERGHDHCGVRAIAGKNGLHAVLECPGQYAAHDLARSESPTGGTGHNFVQRGLDYERAKAELGEAAKLALEALTL